MTSESEVQEGEREPFAFARAWVWRRIHDARIGVRFDPPQSPGWASEYVEVVPREVAERLARAVSASLTHGEESPLKDALQEYLSAYPWSDL